MKKIEIPEDWATYFTMVDDKPASIRLNLALREIAPIKQYSHRFWFSVLLQNPDQNGFTTKEEFPIICRIEDGIVDVLAEKGAVMVGALKSDGKFDLYLYSDEIEYHDELIGSVMEKYPGYKYAINIKKDEEWEDYFLFLYPSEYEYQTIQNQKVLMNLEKHGDNSEIEREVDHWMYFKSENGLDACARKVKELGYTVLSQNELDNGEEFPFQLNISRKDNVVWGNVNNYVWELYTLAAENQGYYDGWGCTIADGS